MDRDNQFFKAIPSIYRYLDQRGDQSLQAFLKVLDGEYQSLYRDTLRLYENIFVETCEPWVIPYIARMVGIPDSDLDQLTVKYQRGRVGKALHLNRRKGTLAALEKAIHAASGWGVHVVEFARYAAITQNLDIPTSGLGKTVSLKGWDTEWIDTAFSEVARTPDIRKGRPGAENITYSETCSLPKGLGVFLWSLRSYMMHRCTPVAIGDGIYTISPLGIDLQLFKYPVPWQDATKAGDIGTVPGPLFSSPIQRSSERYRASLAQGIRYDKETLHRRKHYVIYINDIEIPDEHILVMDLSAGKRTVPNWSDIYLTTKPIAENLIAEPPLLFENLRNVRGGKDKHNNYAVRFRTYAAIDPTTGRLAFPKDVSKHEITLSVNYAYGAPSNLGGGPYDRRENLNRSSEVSIFLPDPSREVSFEQALVNTARNGGVIRITDNGIYTFPKTLRLNSAVTIEAGNGFRPCIEGDLKIQVSGDNAALTLDGLLLKDTIICEGDAENTHLTLKLFHCTLNPDNPVSIRHRSPLDQKNTAKLALSASFCILGSILLEAGINHLSFEDTIIKGQVADVIKSTPIFTLASFERCTILGEVFVRSLQRASNTLFCDTLAVLHQEFGEVRFCYFPKGSRVPSIAYECLDRENMQPRFTSVDYGHPAFCQLLGPDPLYVAAEDGGEMGALHNLYQKQRYSSVAKIIRDHLPFGFEPIVRFIT